MRVTVVGDLLLDVDLDGRSEKLSPDAPAPVVAIESRTRRAGGAGLVATLLARDGVEVELVTAVAGDDPGVRLRRLIEEDPAGRIRLISGDLPAGTPTKTRLRSGGHLVARLDENCDDAPPPQVTSDMLDAIRRAEIVVVADYGRGLLEHEQMLEEIRSAGTRIPVIWDPHPRGARPVDTAALVTPNLSEALALSGTKGTGSAAATVAGAALLAAWGCGAVLVTLGDAGAVLLAADAGIPHHLPAVAVHAVDACGAGDRLVASIARRLVESDRDAAAGAGRRAWPATSTALADAVHGAVADVSRFLAAGGVASLANPANTRPLGGTADSALAVVHSVRAAGGTVVATGGCFDLLHAGHARTLAAARSLGDCLVVCLNSDDSVRRLKGADRPIMNQHDRADLLSALECVDAVLVFDEDTPEQAIRRLCPDVWVKGGDYTSEQLPESAVIAEWGGRTVTVPYHPGRSTTRLAGALSRVG